MTEFWLQKKTIGGWSHVTSYQDEQQARTNYNRCIEGGMSGYSWRLCKVEAIEVAMLNDVVEVSQPEPDRPANILIQGAPKSSWGTPPATWGEKRTSIDLPADSERPEHGLSGSVWLIHHGQRAKVRVKADEAQKYLDEGYVRGGPRTQFEG